MGKILQWRGKKEKHPPFDTQEIIAADENGIWQHKRFLSTNNITQTISQEQVPIILIDNVDVSKCILGIVSCTVDLHGDNWGDQAVVITTRGVIQMRGAEWFCREAPNGYALSPLPLWHFQRAGDINCEAAPDMIKELALGYMEALKKYCDYVYSDDSRIYEYNPGLVG